MEKRKFYQIKNITEHEYVLVGCDGSVITRPIQDVDKSASAFTIQDAKEGDVLFHSDSASNGIFIFKEIIDKGFAKKVICYCDYDSEDHFCLGEHHTCCWTDAKILYPATKEQREQLEKAMADAGWEFDFEKKELKKIKDEIEIPFGAKDSELQEDTYYIPKGFHAEIDEDKVVIKKGEKPIWSEMDKAITRAISSNLELLKNRGDGEVNEAAYQSEIKWLKALKDRVGCEANCTTTKEWKPSDAQMIALNDIIINGNLSNANERILKGLQEQLKKLK